MDFARRRDRSRLTSALTALGGLVATLITAGAAPPASAADAVVAVAYRVNAGGPAVTASPSWTIDSVGSPSTFVNAAATGNTTTATSAAIDTTHASIPPGTPAQIFASERWDSSAAPAMQWDFPVTAGQRYEVRLYFAETYVGTKAVGARGFDVTIDGVMVLDNYDIFAKVGADKGIVERFTITSDANIDINFAHVVENPAITGIEIVQLGAGANQLSSTPGSLGFGSVLVNSGPNQDLQFSNQGAASDPPITITGTTVTGTNASMFTDNFDDAAGATIAGGASTSITVTFRPTSTGTKSASLVVAHTGANSPLTIPLSGTGTSSSTVAFSKGVLTGETSSQPTSLQFGPDGRLYVAQQNGLIKIYGVNRSGKDSYSVVSTQTITSIRSIPNRNDDGTLNPSVVDRQVTGLLVVGTAANPVIYVGSSDPRIGGGSAGTDTGLDTNSGILSRLTWTGSAWQKVDLVRGLPRSEENHSINGLHLNAATNVLYLAEGGNTNQGGTSNNFAKLPEVALSAAILSVDLNAIGNTTYDLPTLDDSARSGAIDANDPFGGNNGNNQARLVPGGPVQVYNAGYRNAYDIVATQSGRMYTVDNGGNAGWGGVPVNEGPGGACTNGISEPGATSVDTLHLITAGGYGGHPNPTRGNINNTFSSPAQSPISAANPIECDWRSPGPERGNITAYPASTNGLTEYTASNFAGQMKGDLLMASFDNAIYRAKLDGAGTKLLQGQALFQSVGSTPLDVIAQGDAGPFPGTVWVADIGNGMIHVFEPSDFGGGGGTTCAGTDSTTLDEDGDGFKNADEIDNATNPCSSADVPPDRDGDKVSDLNDPDDDNDTLPDTSDPFAIDAKNGTTTSTPLRLTWDNDAPPVGGLLTLGFTGLMTNGVSNYQSLFDPLKMTAGGAAGVATVDQVSPGDAFASQNSQEYALQVGVMPASDIVTAHTRILGPFAGLTPQGYQSMGLFIGTGNQDNYSKLVVSANGGAGGVEFLHEVGGVVSHRPMASVALPGPDSIDLYLTIDRVASTVQPSFTTTIGTTTTARTNVGAPQPIPSAWHTGAAAMAAGIISTSAGGPVFPATWDFLEVVPETVGQPTIVANPSSVSLSGTQSGAAKTATVAISTSNGAAATFTAASNASWLSATPASGTSPSSITIAANPSGLSVGTHTGTISVTAPNFTTVQIPVTFNVSAEVVRTLAASPSSVSLSGVQGGAGQSASVALSSSDGSVAAFSVTDDAAWLTAAPVSGSTPASVSLTASTSGLAAGTYQATVTVAASGYTSVQVPVTFVVSASTTYDLVFSSSNTRSAPQPLHSQTVSGNIFAFTTPTTGVTRVRFYIDNPARSGSPYRTETTAPYDLGGGSVQTANAYNTAQLANGQHTITAAIDFSNGGKQIIHATITVANGTVTKKLAASPSSVSLSGVQGGAGQSASVALSSSDGSVAAFSVTDDAAWLTAAPVSGSTPASVSLTASTSGLAAGTYQATVTVAASGYTSVQVPVTFVVSASTTYDLVFSSSNTRSAPQPLHSQTVSGNIFAFTTPTTGVTRVRFYIDNPARSGSPYRTETTAPYDLGGGSVQTANAYNTAQLANGQHTITAAIDFSNGGKQIIHATITVANGTGVAWTSATAMPIALGEVASGVVGGRAYVVGEGSPATLAYDFTAKTWTSQGLAPRPFPGNHHGAEVFGGKLYLFGGLGGGSDGKVQIYDPIANTWTQGATMPFVAGSSSTAVIGNQIYVAGGIVGSVTTAAAARYDPAANTWTSIASMPFGRNHAAAESDGAKMFVFGGRGAGSGDGNTVANGFDTVQVYDPGTNTWVSSLDTGSTLAPLPQARGGTGTSVYVNGEFYVIGGETSTGAGATPSGVYSRVDVYNPTTNSWRAGPSMPTARHGIFPVLNGGQIHVAGGGTQAGFSSSNIHDVLRTV